MHANVVGSMHAAVLCTLVLRWGWANFDGIMNLGVCHTASTNNRRSKATLPWTCAVQFTSTDLMAHTTHQTRSQDKCCKLLPASMCLDKRREWRIEGPSVFFAIPNSHFRILSNWVVRNKWDWDLNLSLPQQMADLWTSQFYFIGHFIAQRFSLWELVTNWTFSPLCLNVGLHVSRSCSSADISITECGSGHEWQWCWIGTCFRTEGKHLSSEVFCEDMQSVCPAATF